MQFLTQSAFDSEPNVSGKLLLIDDHQQIARIFQVFLEKTRHAAMAFEATLTLEQGLEIIKREVVSVIVLDNYLGLYENYEEPLRQIRSLTDAPVILLTGSELSEIGLSEVPDELAGYLWKVGLLPEHIESVLDELFPAEACCSASKLNR